MKADGRSWGPWKLLDGTQKHAGVRKRCWIRGPPNSRWRHIHHLSCAWKKPERVGWEGCCCSCGPLDGRKRKRIQGRVRWHAPWQQGHALQQAIGKRKTPKRGCVFGGARDATLCTRSPEALPLVSCRYLAREILERNDVPLEPFPSSRLPVAILVPGVQMTFCIRSVQRIFSSGRWGLPVPFPSL